MYGAPATPERSPVASSGVHPPELSSIPDVLNWIRYGSVVIPRFLPDAPPTTCTSCTKAATYLSAVGVAIRGSTNLDPELAMYSQSAPIGTTYIWLLVAAMLMRAAYNTPPSTQHENAEANGLGVGVMVESAKLWSICFVSTNMNRSIWPPSVLYCVIYDRIPADPDVVTMNLSITAEYSIAWIPAPAAKVEVPPGGTSTMLSDNHEVDSDVIVDTGTVRYILVLVVK